MSNLIDNSDDDSNTTVIRPFNWLEADYAYEFENEFETQIRNEVRDEVAAQHQRELRVLQEELVQTKLKLSATRHQLLRAHIRIRALPLPINTVDYTPPPVNPIPYSTTIDILRSNYTHQYEYLHNRAEQDDCPEDIIYEYHRFVDATTDLAPDLRDYYPIDYPIDNIEENYI